VSQNAQEAPKHARQGHRYTYHQKHVLAMESGWFVRILVFDPERPWVSYTTHARASKLEPQPMKYFRGEIPK
jgi:hypothetical protein